MSLNSSVMRFELDKIQLKRLSKRILKLPEKVRDKVVRKAVKAATAVFLDAAVGTAPVGETADLVENLNMSVRKKRRDRDVMVGLAGPHEDQEYGWMINFGTKYVAAREWMEKAYTHSRGKALLALRRVVTFEWRKII